LFFKLSPRLVELAQAQQYQSVT